MLGDGGLGLTRTPPSARESPALPPKGDAPLLEDMSEAELTVVPLLGASWLMYNEWY